MISFGVPQGFVLGPLLFLIYNINDLNKTISHLLIHHFADNTNILFLNKGLKQINKYINHDLAQTYWLRANHISLNSNKTEIILFQPKNKRISKKLNFTVSGQKIEPVKPTKYFHIYLDKHMTWDFQISQIKMLCKTRPSINSNS